MKLPQVFPAQDDENIRARQWVKETIACGDRATGDDGGIVHSMLSLSDLLILLQSIREMNVCGDRAGHVVLCVTYEAP